MVKLSSMEAKALTVLWGSSKGLDAFSFFQRLKVSFSDFSKIIRTLTSKGFINEKKADFFVITPEGVNELTRKSSYKKNRPWRDVPKRFISNKISTSDHYVPSLCLLDKNTFNID
ncbi:hypothetical protein ACEV7K_09735 [Vibrio parahaemolyticus]